MRRGQFKWLFFAGIMWLLASPTNLWMENQKAAGENQSIYVEMSKILSQFNPGIDYNELHALYRERERPIPFSYSYQYISIPRTNTADFKMSGSGAQALIRP